MTISPVRGDIFVENTDENFQAPSGATSSEYAAPTALRNGGRETLKEKLKPYLQTGERSE
jgi:hypothetical protein